MISMPETHEQWMVWGKSDVQQVHRVGLNFGAPGDRMTDKGTLWLDTPSVGGPSPELDLQISPKSVKAFYEHSLWIEGGRGWPWVGASGITGVREISLKQIKAGDYTVRLYFREPEYSSTGQRVFDISLNGKPLISQLDVLQETQSNQKILVREFSQIHLDNDLNLTLTAQKREPLICGLELIEQSLPIDSIVELPSQKQELLTKP